MICTEMKSMSIVTDILDEKRIREDITKRDYSALLHECRRTVTLPRYLLFYYLSSYTDVSWKALLLDPELYILLDIGISTWIDVLKVYISHKGEYNWLSLEIPEYGHSYVDKQYNNTGVYAE